MPVVQEGALNSAASSESNFFQNVGPDTDDDENDDKAVQTPPNPQEAQPIEVSNQPALPQDMNLGAPRKPPGSSVRDNSPRRTRRFHQRRYARVTSKLRSRDGNAAATD